MKKIILLTSYPFAEKNKEPLHLLRKNNFTLIDLAIKEKRKLTKEEILKFISQADGIIAGTEKYDAEILSNAKNLKIISRLGIGLDNIDFKETKKRKIAVAYTPDAPSRAVAELTIGLIINLSRRINQVDSDLRNSKWNRYVGLDIYNKTVGIIGLGRIGKLVVKLLKPFQCNILVNDINTDYDFINKHKLVLTEKNEIYKKSDIITLHLPKTKRTYNMLNFKKFKLLKNNCLLINTSRGGIINENDLYDHLKNNPNFMAAVDVFENEPYNGKLCSLNNIILTPHLGSCSENSRYLMETGAVNNLINFFESIVSNTCPPNTPKIGE